MGADVTCIEIFNTFINTLIGGALVALAFKANEIAKASKEANAMRLSDGERASFLRNFEKVSHSHGLVLQKGRGTAESWALLNAARLQASIELPEDVIAYITNFQDMIAESMCLYSFYYDEQGQPRNMDKHEERDRKIKEHGELLKEMMKLRPHEIYRQHLEVKKHT